MQHLILIFFVCIGQVAIARPLGNVLFIGDSLSMDEFGIEALKELEHESVISYRFFAGCGSKPESWTKKTNPSTTSCGYWNKTSHGDEQRIPWSRFFPKSKALPFIEDLLASEKTDTLILQLGLNMLDDQNPSNGLSVTYVKNSLNQFKKALLSDPANLPSQCFWITPNKTALWSDQMILNLNSLIAENIGATCTLINGYSLTQTATLSPGSYHLYGKDARNFAKNAFEMIRNF